MSFPDINAYLADRLREAREAKGLVQTDLADALGCSQSKVAKMETRAKRLDLDDVAQYAAAVGLDPRIVLCEALDRAGYPCNS